VQQALARKVVTELKDFDNVYYEVCNEPYERPGLTREWNDTIITAMVARVKSGANISWLTMSITAAAPASGAGGRARAGA
jgi:hypothetical protein